MSQAYWFNSRWRYKTGDEPGWRYADFRPDIPSDATQVEKRYGTKRGGYSYKPVTTERTA